MLLVRRREMNEGNNKGRIDWDPHVRNDVPGTSRVSERYLDMREDVHGCAMPCHLLVKLSCTVLQEQRPALQPRPVFAGGCIRVGPNV